MAESWYINCVADKEPPRKNEMTKMITTNCNVIDCQDYTIVRYNRKTQRDEVTDLGSDDFETAKAMLLADPSLGYGIRNNKCPGTVWTARHGWEIE
jgi:hypothetical protein